MRGTPEPHIAGGHSSPSPSRARSHRRYLSDDVLHKSGSPSDSQDEFNDDLDQEEVQVYNEHSQSYIGISISAQQTRLASPNTPVAEKAAFIGHDAFPQNNALYSVSNAPSNESNKQNIPEPADSTSTQTRPPPDSSQTAGGSGHRNDSSITSVLRSVIAGRARSSTASSSHEPERSTRKLLPISLPSFPKFSGPPRTLNHSKESTFLWLRQNPNHSFSTSHSNTQDQTSSSSVTSRGLSSRTDSANSASTRPTPPIRRSTSDGSLVLLRAQSYASSLGDDSRWEHIQEQVNVRAKAVRDSIVDSSLRLPRFSLPWHESSSSYSKSPKREHFLNATTEARDFGRSRSTAGDQACGDRPTPRHGSRSLTPLGIIGTDDSHPQFSRALKRLTGDLVVLGGYRGSILRSAEPPNRQLWVPIKVGLGVRKVHLEVGLEPEDDEKMEETIIPAGMLKNIGPIDISRRLFKRLRHSENVKNGTLRIWDYGYDWRLSPELLSRQLHQFLENLPSNRENHGGRSKGALIICHSLGGLITRHVINAALKSKQDLVSGVIYAGVPQTCVNILGPLRNGDDVMLSSKVLTAQVNFTIRTSFALLPLDGVCFVDQDTKEEYRVDFFDPKTWEEYCLSPCCARPLPPNNAEIEHPSVVNQLIHSVTSMLPSSTARKSSANGAFSQNEELDEEPASQSTPRQILVSNLYQPPPKQTHGESEEKTPGTIVTIPKHDAMRYLTRVLGEVKQFKEELAFEPSLEEQYPPAAVMYGKSIPTVIGAAVRGREGIKCADAYDNLMFASGDGVVLARAAQIPDGYRVVKGGVVSSDRGHISLLGDLEAVGQCINAVLSEQKRRFKKQALANGANEHNIDCSLNK